MSPNAQGKPLLEFRPVENCAMTNAVEVLAASDPAAARSTR
jgi:hypothetical protein